MQKEKVMYDELPLVEFEYPDSETDYLRTRYVRVESLDHTHLKGHEFTVRDPSDSDEGKYKSYLLAKIVRGGISLLEFRVSLTHRSRLATHPAASHGSLP